MRWSGSSEATESVELPTILLLAVETAMRRAEIVGIHREHLDLQRGIVHLPDTKNGRSRDVPLSPRAREALRRWVAGKPSRGLIFSMQPSSVTRAFIRARKRARQRYEGLCQQHGRRPNAEYFRNLRFHDFRHEAVSRLARILRCTISPRSPATPTRGCYQVLPPGCGLSRQQAGEE